VRYSFSESERKLVLFLRSAGLALDDIVDQLAMLMPQNVRSSVYRLLVREGVGRLQKADQQPSGEPGVFKAYDPGFLHIDCFYLPILEGKKRYAFVSIDRATRLVFVGIYERKDKEAAAHFLKCCLAFYPFCVRTILTDNGSEFTNAFYKRRLGIKCKKTHPFVEICQEQGIEHRQTQPYTPRTNGMAERTVGLIKSGTTKQHRYENAHQMIADLHTWMIVYNFERRHRRLGLKTPYQATCEWHQKRPDIYIREPTSLLTQRS